MDAKDIFKAAGDISDDLIVASEKKKAGIFTRYRLTLAITAALVIALAVMLLKPPAAEPGLFVIAEAKMPDAATSMTDPDSFLESADYEKWSRLMWEYRRDSSQVNENIAGFYEKTVASFLKEDENSVYSPLNVYLALAMLAETTGSSTQAEILNVLGVSDLKELRENCEALWNANYSDVPVLKSILSNSFWLNEDVQFKEGVLKQLADTYKASSFAGDPGDPAYSQKFRDWLNESTKGLLKEYVSNEAFEPAMIVTLCSAIYYKAAWMDEFMTSQTEQADFHTPDSTVQVSMMHRSMIDSYYRGKSFTAVSLELAESGRMWFFLPDEDSCVKDVLSDEAMFEIIRNPYEYSRQNEAIIHLGLPSFDISSTMDLIGPLRELGIETVFTADADFTPLTDTPANVTDIHHNARLKADETGIEGAAYSVITADGATAFHEYDEIEVIFDRPFVFAVTGRDGSFLFSGTVCNP